MNALSSHRILSSNDNNKKTTHANNGNGWFKQLLIGSKLRLSTSGSNVPLSSNDELKRTWTKDDSSVNYTPSKEANKNTVSVTFDNKFHNKSPPMKEVFASDLTFENPGASSSLGDPTSILLLDPFRATTEDASSGGDLTTETSITDPTDPNEATAPKKRFPFYYKTTQDVVAELNSDAIATKDARIKNLLRENRTLQLSNDSLKVETITLKKGFDTLKEENVKQAKLLARWSNAQDQDGEMMNLIEQCLDLNMENEALLEEKQTWGMTNETSETFLALKSNMGMTDCGSSCFASEWIAKARSACESSIYYDENDGTPSSKNWIKCIFPMWN